MYGLTPEQVKQIKLPYAQHLVEIFEIDKIIHARKKLSTVDQIYHLEKLKEVLEQKLSYVKSKGVTGKVSKSRTVTGAKNSSVLYDESIYEKENDSEVDSPPESNRVSGQQF